jgi:hypothetical protein
LPERRPAALDWRSSNKKGRLSNSPRLIVLFKFVGYSPSGDTPIMPFVWCAVGAHEKPRSPKSSNPLLAGVFQSYDLFSGDGKASSE